MSRRPMFTLGDRIRKARTEAGLDQRALAAALGVNRNTVALWEHDATQPRTASLIAVAAVTDTDLEWIEGKATQDA
jgi:transcriptional regulator with XRE-family HTH domain